METMGKLFERAYKGSPIGGMGAVAAKVGGGIANITGGPWGMAIGAAVSAVEFGIDKFTEYSKVAFENMMRNISATTTANVNVMKAGLESWINSVNGAYEAQILAVDTQKTATNAELETNLANTKMANTWTNWIPIWGNLNKREEAQLEMDKKLIEESYNIAAKYMQAAQQYTKKTDEYLNKQDAAIRNFGRSIMLSVPQMGMFEKNMLNAGKELASLNSTIEDALKNQQATIESYGRNLQFSRNDYMQTVATGKIVGDDNMSNFAAEMSLFNHSVADSAEIMMNMYNNANKMGLSGRKVVKEVLANLKLAEKYNFKGGTKGLIEFAKWAENVRAKLSSVGNITESIQSGGLEGVITKAARLQVLGGNFAMNSDPLRMAYQSLMDPAQLMKDLQSSLKGYGHVNSQTGETEFGGTDIMILRSAAEVYGLDPSELMNMIREDNKKDTVLRQMQNSKLRDKEQKEAVANVAQRGKDGNWYVNTLSGGQMNVNDITEQDIKNILPDNKEDQSIAYAKSTMGFVESIDATAKNIAAMLGAYTMDDFEKFVQTSNEQTLNGFNAAQNAIIESIKETRKNALEEQEKTLGELPNMAKNLQRGVEILELANKGDADALREYFDKESGDQTIKQQLKSYANGGNIDNSSLAKTMVTYLNNKTGSNYTKSDFSSWYTTDDMFINNVLGQLTDKELQALGIDDALLNEVLARWKNSHLINNFELMPVNSQSVRKKLKEKHLEKGTKPWTPRFGQSVRDGIAAANGSPMVAYATDVKEVQDGTIVKSHPQDQAIFAKVGGPFDKLFNGVFDRINEVYSVVADNRASVANNFSNIRSSSSTRIEETSYAHGGEMLYAPTSYGSNVSSISSYLTKMYSNNVSSPSNVLSNTYAQGATSDITPRPLPYSGYIAESVSASNKVDRDKTITHSGNIKIDPVQISLNVNVSSGGQGEADLANMLRNDPNLLRSLSQMISIEVEKKVNGGRVVNPLDRHLAY